MRRVILESPYAGDVALHEAYLRKAMADCFRRGDAPFASHGLYTQPGVLRDDNTTERMKGLEAGWAWVEVAEATVVYADLGISNGMREGIRRAERAGVPVEYRYMYAEGRRGSSA